ncbi:adenylate cyclase [Coemansia interrupta]|uniref:Adenylate cyclase n=1 Tax=Coemansia interrupta TaxID=1126814 RepID=A0A9W8H7W2_9FUNG|nr:adenylate cyclase [Coemansia interrupta]
MASSDVPESVQRFIEYLRIKTVQPTPDYASCTLFLRRQAEEIGLEFSVTECIAGKPIVVLTLPGLCPSEPSIILNSHTDVVPVFPSSWTQDPFGGARVADGADHRIYARGAQDMKIVGMAYLEALRAFRREGTRLRRTVHAVFVPDEEIGGHEGMELFVERDEFRRLNAGFALDEGMANPADELRVFYGERAPCWVKFVARGNAGHGSQFIEDTAGERLHRVVGRMLAFRSEQLELLRRPLDAGGLRTLGDVTSTNLTLLQAGVQHNVVPAEAMAGFDIRMTPNVDYAGFRRWLQQVADEERVELEFVQFWADNTMTPREGAFWAAFEGALGQLATAYRCEIFPAATDSRYLRRAGVPALGVSPLCGLPILLHDHDEYVRESDYLRAVDFYRCVVKALANAE